MRRGLRTAGLLVAVVVVAGVWAGIELWLARQHVQALRADLPALRAASTSGASSARIHQLADRIRQDARVASARAGSPVLALWGEAPWIGTDIDVIRGATQALSDLTDRGLPPLVDLVARSAALRHDTTIDVAALRADAPALVHAEPAVQSAVARIAGLPQPNIGLVARMRDELVDDAVRFGRQMQAVTAAARIGPAMLGADRPRHYLVAVQNLAESRATGGIVSAFGILTTRRGRIHLGRVGSDLHLLSAPGPVVDLGPQFANRYGEFDAAGDWRNVTMTPDFPTAARVMLALWARQHGGQRLDGVIGVDSATLSDILAATGPVQGPDGITLTAANVERVTLVDYYRQYPDKAARSAAFTAATRAVFTALEDGRGSMPRLLERLAHAAVTNHLTLYSTNHAEEGVLRELPISGHPSTQARPYLEVITQDVTGSKLSVYLRRRIDYAGGTAQQDVDLGQGAGPEPVEAGRLTITLHNAAPATGLPDYVVGVAPGTPTPPVRGGESVYLSVYTARAGVLLAATRDGKAIPMQSQADQGRSVFSTTVSLAPGATTTLVLDLRQPTDGGPLSYRAQPLPWPDQLSIRRPWVPG